VLREVFEKAYRSYGYRRIQAVLKTQCGFGLSGKTVLKLMREGSRACLIRETKFVSRKGAVGLALANVLERDFSSSGPNQKRATDVTEFPTEFKVLGQKQYLSSMIDLFNGEVTSYELAPSPVLGPVTNMLDKAFLKLDTGQRPIIHSNQGWHYRHISYQKAAAKDGLVQSMSKNGNCLENFFGHFKEEFLRQQPSPASVSSKLNLMAISTGLSTIALI
jgi:putative transposase